MFKVLWLDTETTGTDPKRNDVVQVAALIEVGGRLVDEFHGVCRPHDLDAVEESALAVNGLTRDQVSGFPEPKVLHGDLCRLFNRHVNKYDRNDKFTIAGMKPDFDAQFMKEFFLKCGDQWWGSWCNWRHVDLLALVRLLRYAGRLEIENDKLGTICAFLGIELARAHDALEDVRATRAALKELLDMHLARPPMEPLKGPLALFEDGVVRADDMDRALESGG